MSDYIINPMWFYFVHIVDSIKVALAIAATIALMGVGLFVMSYFVGLCVEEKPPEALIKYFGIVKKLAVIGLIMAFVAALIPPRRTMIEMKIAQHATYQNIESATDYILERLEDE